SRVATVTSFSLNSTDSTFPPAGTTTAALARTFPSALLPRGGARSFTRGTPCGSLSSTSSAAITLPCAARPSTRPPASVRTGRGRRGGRELRLAVGKEAALGDPIARHDRLGAPEPEDHVLRGRQEEHGVARIGFREPEHLADLRLRDRLRLGRGLGGHHERAV